MSFERLRVRAALRKGGDQALADLLPEVMPSQELAMVPDDRVLATMARCVFNSGFNWRVVDQKWHGFEAAFLGFDIDRLLAQEGVLLDQLISDKRIVRHGTKIRSVFENARFIQSVASDHGSFAHFLANWPKGDQVGLMLVLKKQGARLGGNTGQYFLRFIGYDGFITSRDVIAALQADGLDIADSPTSQRDMRAIQVRFNDWHTETGLPYVHLSRITAMSVGVAPDADADLAEAIKSGDIPQI